MAAKSKPPLKTLRELRLDLGLTLPELADEAGISKATLSMIERGRVVATPAELATLSEQLDVELENRMQVVAEVPAK